MSDGNPARSDIDVIRAAQQRAHVDAAKRHHPNQAAKHAGHHPSKIINTFDNPPVIPGGTEQQAASPASPPA